MSKKKTFSAELDENGITITPPNLSGKKKFLAQRFQPGAPGRKEGSRNRITQQKLGLEEGLRDQMALYMPMVLQKAVELALEGDRTMIKMLAEMHVSKAAPPEDESQGKDTVKVTINDLTLDGSNAKVTLTKTVETPKIEEIDVTPKDDTDE